MVERKFPSKEEEIIRYLFADPDILKKLREVKRRHKAALRSLARLKEKGLPISKKVAALKNIAHLLERNGKMLGAEATRIREEAVGIVGRQEIQNLLENGEAHALLK